MKLQQFAEQLRLRMRHRLQAKAEWGRNEIMAALESTIAEVALDAVDKDAAIKSTEIPGILRHV